MRLLLFLGTLREGGTERQAAVLARGLAARGHAVEAAVVFAGGRYWDELTDAPDVACTALHARRAGGRAAVAAQLLGAPGRLAAHLRRRGPDVVYSMLEIPGLVAWEAARRAGGVPLAWGVRNSDPAAGPLVGLAARAAARLSHRVPLVIHNSEAGRARQRAVGWGGRRELVIPNGIDTARFAPDRARGAALRDAWGGGGGTPLLGVVGRVEPCKDHAGLLRACAGLEGPWRLVVVGDGPAGHLDALRRLAADLDLADRVVWAGRRRDMAAAYNALDLVVSASTTEGFPNVLAEALACGVPCVATDVGDSARILAGSGAVVPPRAPDALRAALAAALAAAPPQPAALHESIARRFGVAPLLAATEDALAALAAGAGEG